MRLIDADELIKVIVKEYSNFRGLGAELAELIDLQSTFDQWYYPSKGEYPPFNKHLSDETKVLLYFRNKSKEMGWYIKTKDKEGWLTYCGWEPLEKVLAWQYIVPPKKEG